MSMIEAEQVELLTGEDAVMLLAHALGTENSTIESWRVDSIHHRPGAGVSAGYELTVRRADGTVTTQVVCASTGKLTRPDAPGVVRLDHPDGLVTVSLWRYPNDPELPALPTATSRRKMTEILEEPVVPSLITYRPTRRAVFRVDGAGGARAFAKVVRPRVQADLVRRHAALEEAEIPAPRVMFSNSDGLVVLSVAQGVPLANFLAAGLEYPTATFDAVHGVLRALPRSLTAMPKHPAWADRVHYYAQAAAVALPEFESRAQKISDEVTRLMNTSDAGPIVATHGDFYEANIVMSGPHDVAAILDVDSLGPGHRVDDVGCLLGHVSVLPNVAPSVYPHVPAIVENWWDQAQRYYDRRALAARAAAVTLSLVAGAKKPTGDEWCRDAVGRLQEAERWLERIGH